MARLLYDVIDEKPVDQPALTGVAQRESGSLAVQREIEAFKAALDGGSPDAAFRHVCRGGTSATPPRHG